MSDVYIFNTLLGFSPQRSSTMKDIQQDAFDFIHLVKHRFINEPSKFNEFAEILGSLRRQPDHTHLISKLRSLFETDHPDLLFELNQFLPKKYESSSQHHGMNTGEDYPPKKKLCTGNNNAWLLRKSSSVLFDNIRDRCIEKNDDEFRVLIHFSETVLAYHDKRITYFQADQIFKNLFKDDPDLFIESNRVLSQSVEAWEGEQSGEKSELLSKGEEDKSGENSELMSKGQKGNESDYGFCNLYEKTMNVKEFYLFEMDMAFSRLESTIKKLDKNPDSLTVLDFKCITKLYDDSDDDRDGGLGEAMVEILKSDPVGRLVGRLVVLQRLRQKKMQLEGQKLQLDRIWNEIFQDIKEKGRVCGHKDFLRRTEMASINGFRN